MAPTQAPDTFFSGYELALITNINAHKADWRKPGGDQWWDKFPEVRDHVFRPVNARLAEGAWAIIFGPWEDKTKIPHLFSYLKDDPEQSIELILEGIELQDEEEDIDEKDEAEDAMDVDK